MAKDLKKEELEKVAGGLPNKTKNNVFVCQECLTEFESFEHNPKCPVCGCSNVK